MKTATGVGLGYIGGRHSRERFDLGEGDGVSAMRSDVGAETLLMWGEMQYNEDITERDIQSLLSNPQFASHTFDLSGD